MPRSYTGFRFVKTLNGGPPARVWCDIKGSSSMYDGEVLRMSGTSGSVALAAANGTAIFGVAGANVIANIATTQIPVYLADQNNVFEAKGIASRTAHFLLGDKVTIIVGSTHNFRVASTVLQGEATACCRIIGWHPDTVPGTAAANQKYWVTFLPAVSIAAGDGTPAK